MAKDRARVLLAAFVFVVFSTQPALLNAQTKPAQPSALGLGSLLHPLKVEELTLRDKAEAIPQVQKDRVHFFLINGIDFLYKGNLNGVAAYFRAIGFANTSCYQFPMTFKARRQIEALRKSDPDAKIVLLGFSTGANCVRALANTLEKDGIRIDCLVYVAGDTVFNTASSKPGNVGQIVNITGHGLIFLGRDIYFKGEDIDGAINHRLDARHMTIPNNNATIALVGQQLITLANAAAPAAASQPQAAPILRIEERR
jgi:pimeloyl-ACP methyl ester carboxylesterase